MKWEYKHITSGHLLTKQELNHEGDAGWELVSILTIRGDFYHTFKRAKIEYGIMLQSNDGRLIEELKEVIKDNG